MRHNSFVELDLIERDKFRKKFRKYEALGTQVGDYRDILWVGGVSYRGTVNPCSQVPTVGSGPWERDEVRLLPTQLLRTFF